MARPKRTESEALATQTREALLTAATEAFAAEGFEAANVNRISQEAGFAKGTIYNYFPSKRDLMLAVLDAAAGAHCTWMAERVLAEDDPVERVAAFFEAGFAFVTAHLPQARVALATVHGHDEGFKQHLWEGYRPMFELVARDIVGAGVAAGVFAPCDVAFTSNAIMTLYLGAGSQVNAEGKHWLNTAALATFVTRALGAA